MNTISNLFLLDLLGAAWNETSMIADCMSDGIAEDRSEAAAYGDGPCGSLLRLTNYHDVLDTLTLWTNWHNELAAPSPKNKPELDPGLSLEEVPF